MPLSKVLVHRVVGRTCLLLYMIRLQKIEKVQRASRNTVDSVFGVRKTNNASTFDISQRFPISFIYCYTEYFL